MNTTGKILILIISVLGIASAILFFWANQVKVPGNIEIQNVHYNFAQEQIDSLSPSANFTRNDSIFVKVDDMLLLYRAENLIDSAQRKQLADKLVSNYVPLLERFCHNELCDKSQHSFMKGRINHLKQYQLISNQRQQLKDCSTWITDFEEASKLAKYTQFRGLNNAKERIKLAGIYANKPHLEQCNALQNELNSLKKRIGDSHFNYLQSQIGILGQYIGNQEFDDQVNSVTLKINEYKNNCSAVYSLCRSVDGFETQVKHLIEKHQRAITQKDIREDLQDEWLEFRSPISGYRAFKSHKNKGISNSKATMSFTITGYSSFTFYIGNDSEYRYDYVVVGKNRLPSTSQFDYTSKGQNTTSNYSLNNYKTITESSLNPTQSYTFYVSYQKDYGGDVGQDCGYLLIPKQ